MRPLLLLLPALFAPFMASAQTAQPDPVLTSGPAPDWVKPVALPVVDRPIASLTDHGGFEWILWDSQRNTVTHESYVHSVYRVLTTEAVADAAHLSGSFDPAYQKLVWNQLTITRDGAVMDRLASAEKQLLPVQDRSDVYTLDSRLQWNLHLQDVRPGDIIQYSYTVSGSNPVFGDRLSGYSVLGWKNGIHHFYERILHPAVTDHPLQWKVIGGVVPSVVSDHDGLTDVAWDITEMPSLLVDDELPRHFSPYPVVFFSDWQSWSEVADWGRALFATPADGDLPASLQEKILQWKLLPDSSSRAVAALEYVQDQIRYLALPFGQHSHQPYPLSTIVQRGFGDCKDKTLLLCTLLRALGIEAEPTFLSTDWESGVTASLPMPLVFDHVVTRIRLGNQWVWVDPTASSQRGPIAQRYFHDYGFCLPLAPLTTGLEPVKPSGLDLSRVRVHEDYRVSNYLDPVKLTIDTVFEGRDADTMRAAYLSQDRQSLEKNWLNDLAKYYPGVQTLAPIQFQDSPEVNQFTVRETYSIKDFWKADPSDEAPRRIAASFHVILVDERLESPGTRVRTMPLALHPPDHIIYDRVVHLPTALSFGPENIAENSPYLRYTSSRLTTGSTLTFKCDYELLAAEVPAADFPSYQSTVDKIRDHISRTLWINSPQSPEKTSANGSSSEVKSMPTVPGYFRDVIFGLGVLAFILSLAACLRIFFLCPLKEPPPEAPQPQDGNPEGLGGWLIMVGLGVCLSPFVYVYNLMQLLPSFGGANAWWLAEPSPHNGWPIRIMFATNIVIYSAMIPLMLLLVMLFFKRRYDFPAVYIAARLLSLLGGLILYWALQHTGGFGETRVAADFNRLIYQVILAAAYIAYIKRSRRVKLTFIY